MGPKPSQEWKHNHWCHHVNTTSRNPLWSNCHNQNPKTSFSYSCGRLQPQFLHNNHFFSWSDFDSLLPRCLPVANVTTTATSQKPAITTRFRLHANLCQSESAQIHNLYHQFFVCTRIVAVCKLSVCASRQRTENYSKTFSSGFLHQTESLSLLSYIKPPCFWNKIILWKTSFIQGFSSLIYPYTV